jgi:S1-C subfamily serine protease
MIEKTRITIVFIVFLVLLLWTGIGHCSNWVVIGEDNERYIYADYDSVNFYVQDGDRYVSLWFKFVPKDRNFPYYAMEFINAREKNLNFIVHDIRFYDARTGQIVKSGYGNEEGWQKSEGTIYRSVFSSIFSSTKQKHKGASGTGFFITPTHLVTNYHVVEGGTQFEILFRDNRYTAELFATDPNNDLAILKVSGLEGDIKPLLIANSRDVKEGTKVYTVGFPMPGQLGLRAKLSDGIINAISGYQDDMRTFQISIPVQPVIVGAHY